MSPSNSSEWTTSTKKVNLSFNAFGDEGVVAIITSPNNLPELRKVDLSDNSVT